MAPEQLAGEPASIKSDLYALGLVLFELFTGRRAVRQRRRSASCARFTTERHGHDAVVDRADLDPAIERVDPALPRERSGAAAGVGAGRRGGAAGRRSAGGGAGGRRDAVAGTAAAAGETDAFPVVRGLLLVAAFVAGALLFVVTSTRVAIMGRVPLNLPPAVLVDRAQQTLAALGYPDEPGDSAGTGFERDAAYLQWLPARDREAPDDPIEKGNPSAVFFWYRTSPRELAPASQHRVTTDDPSLDESGMTYVSLDTAGRLRRMFAVPPSRAADEDVADVNRGSAAPDALWKSAFTAALDQTAFTPTEPQWTPPFFADARGAWEGLLTGSDTGACRGQRLSGPHGLVRRDRPVDASTPCRAAAAGAGRPHLVWHPRRGALRAGDCCRPAGPAESPDRSSRPARRRPVATVVAAAGLFAWLIGGHHSTNLTTEFDSLFRHWRQRRAVDNHDLGALPGARTLRAPVLARQPARLVAPFSGHVRDPRVGRDVLIGLTLGALVGLVAVGRSTILTWLGYNPPTALFGRDPWALPAPGMSSRGG